MAIGDPLSKNWTYGDIEDAARFRTKTIADAIPSPSLMLVEISLAVEKWAKALVAAEFPAYQYTASSLAITGSANPYTVNLSAQNPFPDKFIQGVYVNSVGARTLISFTDPISAEARATQTNLMASSIWGTYEGDSVKLYVGSAITVYTISDTVELKYLRQAKVGSATRASYIDLPDSYAHLAIMEVEAKLWRYAGKPDEKLEEQLLVEFKKIGAK